MAILGALVTGTGVVAGGVVLDLSKMSTAKTELMQVLQSACEHGGAASAAGDKKNDVKSSVRNFAENAYDKSNTLSESGRLSVDFKQGGDSIVVSDTRTVEFVFGGLTGIKDSEVSATFSCDVPPPPLDMTNPDPSCSGDAIKITNARSFRADADTAETLTASRLISVALIDSSDALLERVLVGDGGDPIYERTDLDGSEVIVIQPVVAGEPVPRTCLPTQPSGGGGSGGCLTGSISGSAAGNELDFDTDGTYQAFFIDRDAGANGGNVSNGPSSASTSASLDGPGVTGGSAAVGEGSSASCSSILTDNADVSITSTADGDDTDTTTNTSVTTDEDGNTVAESDATCDASSGNGNGRGNGRGNGKGNGGSGKVSAKGTGTEVRSSGTMSCSSR